MSNKNVFTAIALATALASGGSLALAAPVTAAPAAVAAHDVGKMAAQGQATYLDVMQARLAILNGRPQQAARLLDQANQALQKASKDNTALVAAESQLPLVQSGQEPSASASADATPVSWLPVDASMFVVDDFNAVPAQKAAVASANGHLKKGERAAAMKALKLADIDVSYTAALVPLKATMTDVQVADGLLTAHKYVEANQVLGKIQKSVRVVMLDNDLKIVPATAAK